MVVLIIIKLLQLDFIQVDHQRSNLVFQQLGVLVLLDIISIDAKYLAV